MTHQRVQTLEEIVMEEAAAFDRATPADYTVKGMEREMEARLNALERELKDAMRYLWILAKRAGRGGIEITRAELAAVPSGMTLERYNLVEPEAIVWKAGVR